MIKTTRLAAMMLAILAIGLFISCQKADNKNTASNQADNKAATNVNQNANASSPAANTSSIVKGTPTDAYKAAYKARKDKDIEGMKKVLSKDVLAFLAMMGGADKKKPQSLDDVLRALCEDPQAPTDESRNEKITGDKASLEYPDDKGNWKSMDFVIEDGVWKMAIAKPETPPTAGLKSDKETAGDEKDYK